MPWSLLCFTELLFSTKSFLFLCIGLCGLMFLYVLKEPEPIDWDFYRKGIGSGVVDMYKEAYDSMFYSFPSSANLFC